MKVLVDSSVFLRKLFGEPDPLAEWSQIEEAFASRLVLVEIGRTVDRVRMAGEINDDQVVQLHRETRRILRSVEILSLTENVLARAAGPLPTVVGSLDAIHLATALELQRSLEVPLVLATHDSQLARGARASGLEVVGHD